MMKLLRPCDVERMIHNNGIQENHALIHPTYITSRHLLELNVCIVPRL